jgi:hypothetical protein
VTSALYHILVASLQPVVARALVLELQKGSALDVAVRAVVDNLTTLLPTEPAQKHAQTYLNQVLDATEELGVGIIAPAPAAAPAS